MIKRNGKDYFGHPKFYQILDELAQLHSNKNHDYSGEHDPLRNLKQCEDMGIEAWKGVIVRLTDKMDRLKSYSRKGEFLVGDEGLKDTFRDMAIYAILGIILFEENNGKEKGRVSDIKIGRDTQKQDTKTSKRKR